MSWVAPSQSTYFALRGFVCFAAELEIFCVFAFSGVQSSFSESLWQVLKHWLYRRFLDAVVSFFISRKIILPAALPGLPRFLVARFESLYQEWEEMNKR